MSNFLPLGIRKILSDTGWTENEIAVYSVLLEKGAMDLTTISHETGIAISTIQSVIKSLLLKKMLAKTQVNGKPRYAVTDVEALRKWTKGFLKQFENYENTMRYFVDQYDFNPKIFTSKVRLYEGYRGVKQSYRQMLEDCEEGEEARSFLSIVENISPELDQFFEKEYIPSRIEKNISMKNIALESPRSLVYKKNDKKELRETKLISRKYFPSINTEINLYQDFMHCMSFDNRGAFGVIVQDKALVSILGAIFNFLWFSNEDVRFFEGIEGIKKSYLEMLENCESPEIKSMFNSIEKIQPDLHTFFQTKYIPERMRRNIRSKNIAPYSDTIKKYQKYGSKYMSEFKLVSGEFIPDANFEINIFDNGIHYMSFDERKAFALIVTNDQLIFMLNAVFDSIWIRESGLYMTDNIEDLEVTIDSRKDLYSKDFKKEWKIAKPVIDRTKEGEQIMSILGHEAMSSYTTPYQKKLADILAQKGGNLLSVGYGFGVLARQIEKNRSNKKIKTHFIIEPNTYLAKKAVKNSKNVEIIEEHWQKAIGDFRGIQFDGICFDGYPMSLEEVHRNGIIFIEKIVERNLLKPDGVLTFYVDAFGDLGENFRSYLKKLGFQFIKVEKVKINPPKRSRQIWHQDHFLAPTVKYKP